MNDAGTETLDLDESDPETWSVGAETDQFTIQDSISNETGLWGSWSDNTVAAESNTGTISDTYANEYSTEAVGVDSLSGSASDSSVSYTLTVSQYYGSVEGASASEVSDSHYGVQNGTEAGGSNYRTTYSLNADGTQSFDWENNEQSTYTFDVHSLGTNSYEGSGYITHGDSSAQYQDSGTVSESATVSGWGSLSDGVTTANSLGLTTYSGNDFETNAYGEPGDDGSFLYTDGWIYTYTNSYWGNSTDGFHTTSIENGSGFSSEFGSQFEEGLAIGDVTGLPETPTESSLLAEVDVELAVRYPIPVNDVLIYASPRSVPAELSGSTPGLVTAIAGDVLTFTGSEYAFGFIPSTNAMTAHGLPAEMAAIVGPLGNLAQNLGPTDGVSQTATAAPTAVLVTLAAAGRNPTDITIPTAGSEGSGEEEGDGLAGGASPGDEFAPTGDEPGGTPGTHEVSGEPPPEQSGVGHHYGPRAVVFDPEIAGNLTLEAKQLAMGTFTGPTFPSHRGSGEHAAYNARVKQELQEFIALKGGGVLNEVQMDEFLNNVRLGLDAEGLPDEVLGKFVGKVTAEAEAYQAGIAGRVPNPNLSVAERIELGKKYMSSNPQRFNGLNAMGKTVTALGPINFVVGAVADAKENAPVEGTPPGATSRVIYGKNYFVDPNGTYFVESTGGFWPFSSPKHEKVYVDAQLNEVGRTEINQSQFDMIEEKNRTLYGYMKFNWGTWKWEFVPGLLRESLPTVEEGPARA
jgi:hypothetical protein